MNIYEKELVKILSNSLKDNNEKYKLSKDINVELLFKEASTYDIDSLIYYCIEREGLDLDKVKKRVITINLINIQNNREYNYVLKQLANSGIKILMIKGLILREYYPLKELRTMGDADILVKKEDALKVDKYFKNLNYKCDHETMDFENRYRIHNEYRKNSYINYEVHWHLINPSYFTFDIDNFEEEVWKNAIEVSDNIYKLNTEDCIVYLLLHMATHVKYRGFGLRQLYDVILMMKKEKDNISWNSLKEKCYKYNIGIFYSGIINIIDHYFSEEIIPDEVIVNCSIKEELRDMLFTNIIESGVHGGKNEIEGYEDLSNFGQDEFAYKTANKIFRVFFHRISDISEETNKYDYAKKYKILSPVASIIYLFKDGVFKKYGVISSFKNLRKSMKIRSRKRYLVEALELTQIQ